LFAKPEMGSVRFRVHKIRRRPWPSAARVRPASVPARTPRGTRTPAMTGRRVAWPGLSSPPALTRRTPTKRTTLRLRGGRRTPLVAYAPSLSWAPPTKPVPGLRFCSPSPQPLSCQGRGAYSGRWIGLVESSVCQNQLYPGLVWRRSIRCLGRFEVSYYVVFALNGKCSGCSIIF